MKSAKKLAIIWKWFDSESVYNEKYHKGKINTNFHGDTVPKAF